jgi:hypothetical protein
MALQTQFAASFQSPLPVERATSGYGQSGRVYEYCGQKAGSFDPLVWEAMIWSGALPFATH